VILITLLRVGAFTIHAIIRVRLFEQYNFQIYSLHKKK
jgi:hypothetical protein